MPPKVPGDITEKSIKPWSSDFFSSRIPVSAYVIDPQSLNVTQRVLLTDKITGISQKCLCTKGHMQSARCRVCGGDYFQKYPGNMLP